jgi:hypothetical protein
MAMNTSFEGRSWCFVLQVWWFDSKKKRLQLCKRF